MRFDLKKETEINISHGRGVGIADLQRSVPTPNILRLYLAVRA